MERFTPGCEWVHTPAGIAAEIETAGPGLFVRAHPESPYVWADALFADPANKIYVIDRETFEVVKVIEDGEMTLHPEFNRDARWVFVSDWEGNVIRVYDGKTLELVHTIDGLETPTGIFSVHRREEPLGH